MNACARPRQSAGHYVSEPLEPRTLLSAAFLKDINTTPNGSSPLGTAFDGAYYFFATSPNFGSGLWKTDGSEAGTTLVSGVTTRLPVVLSPFSTEPLKIFGVLNGELLFAGFTSPLGTELWKTDGTAAGTFLVKDTAAGPRDGYPDEFTPAGGEMFFRVGLDSPARSQIWRTDGTESGTVPVLDPATGQPIQGVRTMAAVGGSVYAVTAVFGGARLWRVDAASGAASVLKDFPADRPPDQLMDVGGTLMFAAVPNATDPSDVVWKSDGTPEGTVPVLSPTPQGASSADLLGVVNGVLVFGAADGIWRTDGTPDGTFRVGTMGYNRGSVPGRACVLGDSLYFTGAPNDGSEGLWRTDGTVAGTELVAGGPYDGRYLTNVNGTLFFR